MANSLRIMKMAGHTLKAFFRESFTSKKCPFYWLIALIVNLSLIFGASDLLKEPSSPAVVNDNVTLPPLTGYSNSSAGRVVVFFVDDLTPATFFSSAAKGGILRWAMEQFGVRGLVVSQEKYSGEVSLRMLLSGSEWRGSPLPLEPEYWYVGEETVLGYLRDSEMSLKLNGRVHKGDFGSNLTWATIPKDLNHWIYENTLKIVQDIKERKDQETKKLILVHFTGVKMAKHLEGDDTPLMDETLRETITAIESLVQAFVNLWNDARTVFLVVSNSKESPYILWGSGVSQGKPADQSASQPTEWKTKLTKRRDLERRRISALLFCLLGVHPPKDSFGTLPLEDIEDDGILKAECAMNSAFQLVRLFKDLVAGKKAAGSAKLSAFWSPISEKSVDSLTSNVYNLFINQDYNGVITMAKYLAEKSQLGIEFYMNFNRNLLWLFMLFTSAGWFLCTATWLCPAANPRQPNQENHDPQQNCPCRGLGVILSRRFFLSVLYAVLFGALGAILTYEEISYRLYFHLACNAIVWGCFFDGLKKLSRVYNFAGVQLIHGDAAAKVLSLLHGVLTFISWLFAGDPNALVILLVISLSFSSLACLGGSKNTLHSIWLLSSLPLITTVIDYERLEGVLTPFLSVLIWIVAASFSAYLLAVDPVDFPILAASASTIVALAWRSRRDGGVAEWSYFVPWLVVAFIPFLGSERFPVRLFQVLFSVSSTLFRPNVSAGHQLGILFLMIHAAAWLLFEEYETIQDFLTDSVTRRRAQNNPPPEERPASRQIQLQDIRRSSFFLLHCFFVVPVRQLTSKIITWQGQYEAEFKSTLLRHALSYLLQIFAPIVCLTFLFDHMNRESSRNQSKIIALTMFFYSFMTLVYLVSAYESSPSQVADSVSYFIQPLLICVSFLVALPLSYALTLPSILSLKK